MAEKEPFTVAIPAEALTGLRSRLKKTRWAGDLGNEVWAYGTNLEALKELVDYWQKGFNWRRQEREINRFSHYKTTIEGIPIHFIHEPGKGPRPIPLILSHGWPWTFWDLHGHPPSGGSGRLWAGRPTKAEPAPRIPQGKHI
jgi:hypothetical protein